MPLSSQTFSFIVEADPACWVGLPSYFETKLARTQSNYALEQLRLRFLFAATTTHDTRRSVRALLQMAFETEIGAAVLKVVQPAADVLTSKVCERRRYLDIDTDMNKYNFLFAPALAAAQTERALPARYINLLRTHLASPYARYRVCATAALLCFTAAVLPDIFGAITITKADTVGVVDIANDVPGRVIAKADTVSTADSEVVVAAGFGFERHKADTVTVADASTRLPGHAETRGDVVTTTDTYSVKVTSLSITKADTVTVVDAHS